MMGGMILAGIMIVYMLPQNVSFSDAVQVAGHMGKMNMVNFSFDWNDRYNVWSGVTAGLFLFMSYFGTDQSQVGRYLSGESIAQSRIGLLFNGLLKIPMQVLILFIGVMVFVFYQFVQPPVFFNKVEKAKLENSVYAGNLNTLETEHAQVFQEKSIGIQELLKGIHKEDEAAISAARENLNAIKDKEKSIRTQVVDLLEKADPRAEAKDTDYVFISFVMKYMPVGLVGLLIAVVFSASMSSSASAFNALASTTLVDIYKRTVNRVASETHYLNMSRVFTIAWGIIAVFFATLASQMENLIQAVNILGSIFYGTILGIFVVAFYFNYIKGQAVFWAAVLTQTLVIIIYWKTEIGFLWLNPIGCLLVIFFGTIFQVFFKSKSAKVAS
jgi:Na+/proline symporter